MTELNIKVLGQPHVTLDSQAVTGFGTAKTEALFYFLAVTGQAQTREVLADLFWGEMDEGKAKRNLTKSLSTLRKLVDPYLIIERQTVAFNSDATVRLDAADFETRLSAQDSTSNPNTLKQAIDLYQGDFLEGIYVKDSLPFEEWVINQREHLRELMLDGLETLVNNYLNENDFENGLHYANRLLETDPWRESAHRQMMTLLARSGQRNAALAQYDTCRKILDEEFGVEPTAETTALYERLKTADAPPPHNLPPQPDAFIGRDIELKQVIANLNNANCRLLTLVGPGGVGKTRLALQGAARYTQPGTLAGATGFSGGVYLVALAPLAETSPQAGAALQVLVPAMINALQLPAPGAQDPMTYLINHLRQAPPTLLILDNFEYFIESADRLDRLLQQAPNLKLLVTSRERLNLRQEWVLELSGLNYPPTEATIPLAADESLIANRRFLIPDSSSIANPQKYSAVALFLERAQQVRGDVKLPDEEMPAVVRICRLVDGMPLALELAASLLRLSTCAEIVAGIESNLDFLSSSLRNLPARHRSLRAMFEHSWSLLRPQEQEALRRLSVFRGGFQQEAAKAVAGATLDILASLIDKSLLRHNPSGRYNLHELLRQYTWTKLSEIPAEQEATLNRHSRYYANFLQQRGGEYSAADESKVLAELSAEAGNIRAGWQHAIDPSREVIVADINQYWYLGRFEQAAGLYHKSLAALRAPSPTWDRGLDLHQQGFSAYQQGHYDAARQRLNESLSVLGTAVDPLYAARSGVVLGMIAYDLGELDLAEQLLQQSRSELEALGESRYRGYVLTNLGLTRYAAGQGYSAEIESALRACLAISREVNDRWAVAHTLKNLGLYLSRASEAAGKCGEARTLLQESLARCQNINDTWGQVTTLNALGWVSLTLADREVADDVFRQAIEIGHNEQLTPAVLEALWGLVQSSGDGHDSDQSNRPNWAASVLMLVSEHPAASQPLRQQVRGQLDRLEQSGHLPKNLRPNQKKNDFILIDDLIGQI
ncbi:MAG: hypothetical protein KDI02_07530 [Anaerolineae bacterium]|nr:hypothetical protein [Anaerolineae bacterium]